jgi:hypothetical protein
MKVLVLVLSVVCIISMVSAGTLKLQVSSGSNKNWIAVMDVDEALPTSTIEVKQTSTSWIKMTYEASGINTGYWTYNDWSRTTGFNLPLSFRLTASNGAQVTMNGILSAFPGVAQTFDSGTQYNSSATTAAPTVAPSVGTTAPTTRATTKATIVPTSTPTKAATAAPGACTDKTKVMVPLYVYPGAAWDTVIAGARSAKTVAIINPNSGPGGKPDSTYKTYLQKLQTAGVDMIGYVHTSYGTRNASTVKAEIDIYANDWAPYMKGIFLDEASDKSAQLAYYTDLNSYIKGKGYSYNVINPGIIPDSGYVNAATHIVTFENSGANAASAVVPSYASCQNKEKFVAIAHTVSSGSMQGVANSLLNKGYFGYMYITDGAGGCCTYNQLCSYYSSMASYIGAH